MYPFLRSSSGSLPLGLLVVRSALQTVLLLCADCQSFCCSPGQRDVLLPVRTEPGQPAGRTRRHGKSVRARGSSLHSSHRAGIRHTDRGSSLHSQQPSCRHPVWTSWHAHRHMDHGRRCKACCETRAGTRT